MSYERFETPIDNLEIHEITKEVYEYLRDNDLIDSEVVYIRDLEEQMQDPTPTYTYGTTDLTAGTSELETGKLYFVYE